MFVQNWSQLIDCRRNSRTTVAYINYQQNLVSFEFEKVCQQLKDIWIGQFKTYMRLSWIHSNFHRVWGLHIELSLLVEIRFNFVSGSQFPLKKYFSWNFCKESRVERSSLQRLNFRNFFARVFYLCSSSSKRTIDIKWIIRFFRATRFSDLYVKNSNNRLEVK